MAKISASRFTDLKARVKAECLRRHYSGSVSSYGGTAYDYSTPASTNGRIAKEHKDKNVTPLSAINSNTIPASMTNDDQLSDADVTKMESFVTVCERRSVSDSTGSDCRSGCTGLCRGCQTTCTGSCTGSCTGTCTRACANNCSGTCTNACATGCANNCTGGCNTSCSGCGGDCGGTCQSCRYCASSCNDDCTNGCPGGCSRSSSGCVINQ